ncbi:MAG: competence/damage-inducible protein A [Janthinobacterium lividum]
MGFGLIIIGDEILSGRRLDKHLTKVIELLGARGLALDWAEYVGDDRQRITATLARTFASSDVVFSTGGIGATPDDHTRQCAAAALGVPLALHPEAGALIINRIKAAAAERKGPDGLPTGAAPDFDLPENRHRLAMAEFPRGASIIPNPYNQIAGFSFGHHHFVPGFPVMAWPMIEWVLDEHYQSLHHQSGHIERAVIVAGLMEATVAPLMSEIENEFAGVRAFSLPSVGDAKQTGVRAGRHIELGVKGASSVADAAFERLKQGVLALGGEMFDAEPETGTARDGAAPA